MALSASLTQRFDVEALRTQQFPVTKETTYLNCAAISPLPRRTYNAIQEVNELMMLNPGAAFEKVIMVKMGEFGEAVRELINARDVTEIVGMSSTSLGLNLVAQAIDWKQGDNIVLCDVEFPSNVFPWIKLREQHGVDVRIIASDQGGLTVESLQKAVDSKTRLVAASAVQFFTGHKSDLIALGAFCKARNILFAVDAIQSAAHMPIDVQAMNIDILSAGGQKSLMGPAGQGILYIRRDLADSLKPSMIGPNAVEDYMFWLKYNTTPLPGAARFMTGTFNFSGMVGLLESLKMIEELGVLHIEAHVTELADYTMNKLRGAGYEVITPNAPGTYGPIITFRAAETEEATQAIADGLKQRQIYITKHWNVQKVPFIRVSLHCFNNTQDIDRLLEALKEMQP